MELKNKKVAFLGDSITAGCGTSGAGKDFVALFGKMAECAEVLNYGIGGTRIAPWQPYSENMADGNFCGRSEELDESADIVVVFGGTNDFCHGNAPLGTPDDRTPATFLRSLPFPDESAGRTFLWKTDCDSDTSAPAWRGYAAGGQRHPKILCECSEGKCRMVCTSGT